MLLRVGGLGQNDVCISQLISDPLHPLHSLYSFNGCHPAQAMYGSNKCPCFGEQSVCFSAVESNEALLSLATGVQRSLCHFDRSAAEWRNLAGNWEDFSVRGQIPPSGRNDKMNLCFSRKKIAVFLRRSRRRLRQSQLLQYGKPSMFSGTKRGNLNSYG